MSARLPPPGAAQRVVFLTLPGYSFHELSSAIEVLRCANAVLGTEAYAWCIASPDGTPVPAGNGLALATGCSAAEAGSADLALVCAEAPGAQGLDAPTLALLRRMAVHYPVLGGLGDGVQALARAGLLEGLRAAVHWEHRFAAQELSPRVHFSDQLYSLERGRATSSGGTATLHLMLHWVRARHGVRSAARMAEALGLERIRDAQERQHTPMQARVGHYQGKLIEVAALMEANIEEPLSMNEIAHLVGITRRQLERLFKRHVGEIPTRYYMGVRLRRARELVLQSALSMTEIAVACGFSNGAYFSRCYRETFGCSPREERQGGPCAVAPAAPPVAPLLALADAPALQFGAGLHRQLNSLGSARVYAPA